MPPAGNSIRQFSFTRTASALVIILFLEAKRLQARHAYIRFAWSDHSSCTYSLLLFGGTWESGVLVRHVLREVLERAGAAWADPVRHAALDGPGLALGGAL